MIEVGCGGIVLFMALFALYRALVIQVMACNTQVMSSVLSPARYLSSVSLVTIGTVTVVVNLVTPVWELQRGSSCFHGYKFRAGTLGWGCEYGCAGNTAG